MAKFITVEQLVEKLHEVPQDALVVVHEDLNEAQGMLRSVNVLVAGQDELPYDKGDDVLFCYPELKGKTLVFLSTE